jgi:uncharacterized membrane protein
MMNIYASLIVAVANLLLYKALEIGVFAIVTPISSDVCRLFGVD